MAKPLQILADHDTTHPRTSKPQRFFNAVADRISTLSHVQLVLILWLSSFAMCLFLLGSSRDSIQGTMNIVENWGAVERVALWQDFLEPVIPRFQLPTGVIAWGFRAAMLAGFVTQVAAFLVVMKGKPNPSILRWMIGPLGAHIIMTIFMLPSNSDVFFYEAVGDFAAQGINPYVSELMDQPDNPLIPFNYWIDIGTVYGAHWVNYNRILMAITGPDPIVATLVQKVLVGLVAIVLAFVIYWFAKRLSRGDQRIAVASAVLVAWQPNMLLESSGQVHNDLHTVLAVTLGLALAVVGGLRALRGGIVLVAFSVMIKFITLPLLGVLGVIRLVEHRKPQGIRRILGNWVLDGVAIVAVIVGAFLPYWVGPETLDEMLDEPDRLYSHPVWRAIQSILRWGFPDGVADVWTSVSRSGLQLGSMLVFIGIVARLGWTLWHAHQVTDDPDVSDIQADGLPWWTGHVLKAWLVIFMILAYIPVNSHPWYWVWPVAAVAVYLAYHLKPDEGWTSRMLPPWFWWYVWGNALLTLMYHTRIARY